LDPYARAEGSRATDALDRNAAPDLDLNAFRAPLGATEGLGLKLSFLSQWFWNDIFFIGMLLLALTGVILRLPIVYWVVLTPIFGLISIAEGWSHFHTRRERVGFAYRVAAIWCALLLCIYLLYSSSVQGVMNLNASSLATMTLLALGTFVAGLQARVWQISGVGAVLFLTVPGVGWLDQSPLLVTATAFAIVVLGGVVLWVKQRHANAEADAQPPRHSPSDAPLDDGSLRSS
jgi:hypothetical protein